MQNLASIQKRTSPVKFARLAEKSGKGSISNLNQLRYKRLYPQRSLKLYTGDEEFLRARAWPLLRGASLFFLDYLVEHPETGKLVSGPSSSPENSFLTDAGGVADTAMGNSMDQQVEGSLEVCFKVEIHI